MSTFGKALAIVNVLAAIGFLVLASGNYAKRHSFDYSVQVNGFIIDGIALDDKEKDSEQQLLAKLITPQMSKDLGIVEKSQKEVVEKRRDKLLGAVSAAADKKAELLKILGPLARTYGERVQLAADNADDLTSKLNQAVNEALQGQMPGTFDAANASQKLANDQQRTVMAHFLFGTSMDGADFQTTIAAVGLTHYIRELDSQTLAIEGMTRVVEAGIASDRSTFASNHGAYIQDIIGLKERLDVQIEVLRRQENLLTQYQSLIAARQKDIEDLNKEIAAATATKVAALATQSQLEKAIHSAEVLINKTERDNQTREREIRSQELGR